MDMLKLAEEICVGPYRLKLATQKRVFHKELASCAGCPNLSKISSDFDEDVSFKQHHCDALNRQLDVKVERYLAGCKLGVDSLPFDPECPLPRI